MSYAEKVCLFLKLIFSNAFFTKKVGHPKAMSGFSKSFSIGSVHCPCSLCFNYLSNNTFGTPLSPLWYLIFYQNILVEKQLRSEVARLKTGLQESTAVLENLRYRHTIELLFSRILDPRCLNIR